MTRRAARMLAALEDGCATRDEIFAHAGRFFLCNNAASDLRRAGIEVAWDRETDSYRLLGEGFRDNGAESTLPPLSEEPLAEETGQLAWDIAA